MENGNQTLEKWNAKVGNMIMATSNFLTHNFLVQQTVVHLLNHQMDTYFPIQVQLKELWCLFYAGMMINDPSKRREI